MNDLKIRLGIMSGVDDGTELALQTSRDGQLQDDDWIISIGRRDENDICLRNDTFVSRHHANLHWRDNQWWLEDRNSTNGTFTEETDAYFSDRRVNGIVPVSYDQLFRVGRTWLRIQPVE